VAAGRLAAGHEPQIKTVYEIAPVFPNKTMRIESFFTRYFLALLVQARPSSNGSGDSP
jgi:hypothetical protein